MLREIRLYIQSGSCVLGHWPQKTTSLCKSAMKQLKIEESIRYVVVDRLNSYQYPIGIRLSLFLMLCVSQSQLVLPTTYANRFHPTNQPSFVGKNVFWFHFSCHKVKVSDGIAPTLFPPSISSSILLLPQMHTEHQLGGGGCIRVDWTLKAQRERRLRHSKSRHMLQFVVSGPRIFFLFLLPTKSFLHFKEEV